MKKMTLRLWKEHANKPVPKPYEGTLANNMSFWRFEKIFKIASEGNLPESASPSEKKDYEIIRLMFGL